MEALRKVPSICESLDLIRAVKHMQPLFETAFLTVAPTWTSHNDDISEAPMPIFSREFQSFEPAAVD